MTLDAGNKRTATQAMTDGNSISNSNNNAQVEMAEVQGQIDYINGYLIMNGYEGTLDFDLMATFAPAHLLQQQQQQTTQKDDSDKPKPSKNTRHPMHTNSSSSATLPEANKLILKGNVALIYRLIQQRQADESAKADMEVRLRRLSNDLTTQQDRMRQLQEQLQTAEREKDRLAASLDTANRNNSKLTSQLAESTADLSRMRAAVATKERTYGTELRRRERDADRLQEQLAILLKEKYRQGTPAFGSSSTPSNYNSAQTGNSSTTSLQLIQIAPAPRAINLNNSVTSANGTLSSDGIGMSVGSRMSLSNVSSGNALLLSAAAAAASGPNQTQACFDAFWKDKCAALESQLLTQSRCTESLRSLLANLYFVLVEMLSGHPQFASLLAGKQQSTTTSSSSNSSASAKDTLNVFLSATELASLSSMFVSNNSNSSNNQMFQKITASIQLLIDSLQDILSSSMDASTVLAQRDASIAELKAQLSATNELLRHRSDELLIIQQQQQELQNKPNSNIPSKDGQGSKIPLSKTSWVKGILSGQGS